MGEVEDHLPSTGQGLPTRRAARRRSPARLVPHITSLLVVLCCMLGAGLYLGDRIIGALPDVGKNLHPVDSWAAPIAIERQSNGWLIAHIPPCAQSPVAGLFLWDEHDRPFWELRGQAFPIGDFAVGGVPAGLKVVHKLEAPSPSQVLRLGVFRATGRPAGVTFRIRDLRAGKVRYRGRWLSIDQFKVLARCPKPKTDKKSTSTSTPVTLPPQTVPASTAPSPTFPSVTSTLPGTSAP